MAFPPTATFDQLFPFQTNFEAKLLSSPETLVLCLTRQQKSENRNEKESNGIVR